MQIWKSTAGGRTSKVEGAAFLWKDARPHWLIMCCKLLTFQQGRAAAPSSDQSGLSISLASETEVDR